MKLDLKAARDFRNIGRNKGSNHGLNRRCKFVCSFLTIFSTVAHSNHPFQLLRSSTPYTDVNGRACFVARHYGIPRAKTSRKMLEFMSVPHPTHQPPSDPLPFSTLTVHPSISSRLFPFIRRTTTRELNRTCRPLFSSLEIICGRPLSSFVRQPVRASSQTPFQGYLLLSAIELLVRKLLNEPKLCVLLIRPWPSCSALFPYCSVFVDYGRLSNTLFPQLLRSGTVLRSKRSSIHQQALNGIGISIEQKEYFDEMLLLRRISSYNCKGDKRKLSTEASS